MTDILEKKLGYTFHDKALLQEALTHSSARIDSDKNYERLEFLGDRVLGLVIAELLFKKYRTEAEGDLAKRHAALVQKKALYKVSQSLGLGQFLSLSNNEEETGGRKKEAILADAVESLLGAIYLDSGFEDAKKIIITLFTPLIETQKAPPQDPKTQLQEYAQAQNKGLPTYILKNQDGPSHAPTFEVEVTVKDYPSFSASDSSKRSAEKKAARLLLNHLEKKETQK